MSTMNLTAASLTIGYRDRKVLENLDVSFPTGVVTAILGPNGCGKSTLLRAMARLIKPDSGRITLEGADIHSSNTRALARRLAILPQAPVAPDGITVIELVKRGRSPWRGFLSPWTNEDAEACAKALQDVAMTEMADRLLSELSGGQRQRAWLALVLAQQTPLVLLDEPTTWLDLPHQIELLSLLRDRNRKSGMTVVSVLHDINLAARFSDHLVLMGPKGLVAVGTPAEVITGQNLEAAFALRSHIMPDPVSGSPMVIPL